MRSAVPPPSGGASAADRNNRAGLTLVGLVLCLYAVGLIESVWHLPVPNHRRRRFLSALSSSSSGKGARQPQLGGNINVAKSGLEEGQDDMVGEDLDDPEADQDDRWEEGDGAASAGDDAAGDEGAAPAGRPKASAGRPKPRSGSAIPEARWPVSIRDEDGQFEDVVHPGHRAMLHPDVIMSVPRFWVDDPVSVHKDGLMSRETAMRIGSCVTPDASGNHARGDACPESERTIFVAIASYRDWQCRDTVTSIFSRAKHPERVRVGVVDQIVVGEDGSCDAPYEPCGEDPDQAICRYRSQLDVFQVDAPLSIGPVFARHLGHRMYRGESLPDACCVGGCGDKVFGKPRTFPDDGSMTLTLFHGILPSLNPRSCQNKQNRRVLLHAERCPRNLHPGLGRGHNRAAGGHEE